MGVPLASETIEQVPVLPVLPVSRVESSVLAVTRTAAAGLGVAAVLTVLS
jgi:hypothetical protein